jgi:hypothetical protein
MVKGSAGETARKFPDIEAGLDLFDPGRIAPEDPVHPSIDPEPIFFSFEFATDRDFGFVGRIRLCPLPLHADMYLMPLCGRPSIPGMGLDAPGPGNRHREIADRDRNKL